MSAHRLVFGRERLANTDEVDQEPPRRHRVNWRTWILSAVAIAGAAAAWFS